jgi:cold shock CspA family protein
MSQERKSGKVKSWLSHRDFGFLTTDDRPEIFFHRSEWVETDEPRRGDKVSFLEGVGRDQRMIARQVMRE